MADHNNNSPHSNTFLKNLSQKKYAWMEEASSITTPPFPVNKTSDQKSAEPSPRSSQPQPQAAPKKSKKQKLSPEPETIKKQKHIKTSPSVPNMIDDKVTYGEMKTDIPTTTPTPTTPTTTMTSTIINNEKETPTVVKQDIQPNRPQPHFKYTTFPVKGYNILPTRNITSTFARNDTTYFPGSKAGAEEISPDVSTFVKNLITFLLIT